MKARFTIGACVVALAACGVVAAYALADDVITTSPVGFSYTNSEFTITGGQVAQFQNGTAGTDHNVTSTDTKTLGGKPLFASRTIIGGQSASVNGTQYLAPGDYKFFCTVHGPIMSATLHVVGGTPVARPALTLAIASKRVTAVRKSGKLAVTVADSGSDATGVRLAASLKGKTLARKSGIDVAAGDTQHLSLKLTKAGSKALVGIDKATVKLAGTVAFGAPAHATRTLN